MRYRTKALQIIREVNKALQRVIQTRTDANEVDASFIDRLKAAAVAVLARFGLYNVVSSTFEDFDFANRNYYEGIAGTKALGLNKMSVPNEMLENWIKRNVALITNTSLTEVQRLEGLFRDAAFSNIRADEFQKQISKVFKYGRNNAKLIAMDQSGKLWGQLNEYRQTRAGIKGYYWRTTRIWSRVRPKHAAREGQFFLWSRPPDGGHPGQEIRCMCHAEAALDRM
jgi:SPP1 gp7 family putative phage head morphogenesis protein